MRYEWILGGYSYVMLTLKYPWVGKISGIWSIAIKSRISSRSIEAHLSNYSEAQEVCFVNQRGLRSVGFLLNITLSTSILTLKARFPFLWPVVPYRIPTTIHEFLPLNLCPLYHSMVSPRCNERSWRPRPSKLAHVWFLMSWARYK